MKSNILFPELIFAGKTLTGNNVSKNTRYIKDLEGLFIDEQARKIMNQDSIAYEVYIYSPVAENTKLLCVSIPIAAQYKYPFYKGITKGGSQAFMASDNA